MAGKKNYAKLSVEYTIDKNNVRRKVYVDRNKKKPQSKKKRKMYDLEETAILLKGMGVEVTGDNRLEKQDIDKLREFLKGFNLVDYFRKHKILFDKLGYKDDMWLNLNLSQLGTDKIQVAMEDKNENITIIRNIYAKWNEVEHESFHLDKKLQGQNIGKDVLKIEMEEYRKSGIDKIILSANSDIGGYAWARYGFLCEINRIDEIAHLVMGNTNPRDMPKEDKELISNTIYNWRKKNPTKNLFPVNIIASLHNLQGKHIGKQLLKGTGWAAEMSLNDKEANKMFDEYVNNK